MHEFPPNINPRLATLIAILLAYVAMDDQTAREQIAFGNWIIQIGQTLVTTGNYQELLEARITGDEKINLNSRNFKSGGSPWIHSPKSPPNWEQLYKTFKSQITEEELNNIQQTIEKINEELAKMRKEFDK